MRKLFEQCPACGGTLVITTVRCANCATEIRGEFASGEAAALPDEQWNFVKVFLRARGNLTEVEKNLGVSYPTIRNKLDAVLKTLDRIATDPAPAATALASPDPTARAAVPADAERQVILARVESGELSAQAALEQLARLKSTGE